MGTNLKSIIFVGALALQGCTTFGDGLAKFSSNPDGATVTIEGYGDCITPCTARIYSPVMVTIAKIGFTPQRFQVGPGTKNIKVELELAASTEDVEEETLPAL